jgi:hypothetical protein
MSNWALRLVAAVALVAAPAGMARAEDFYVAQKNAVYITAARELPWNNLSTLPLYLLEDRHHIQSLEVFDRFKNKVVDVSMPDLQDRFQSPNLTFDSLLVNEGRLFQKYGPLRLFKEYPTDSIDRSVAVTARPRHGLIFVAVASPQKNGFEGSTCIVTDTKTKRDVHVVHRISGLYAFLQPILTWISDRTVLEFDYSPLGSGACYLDTQLDNRKMAWDPPRGTQFFFSFDGSDLTFFISDGDHFDPKTFYNFAAELFSPSIPTVPGLTSI